MWPLGPTRTDAVAWAVALVLAVSGTLIAWAAGARLGAALTLGAIVLIAVIVTALIVDARAHRGAEIPAPRDD